MKSGILILLLATVVTNAFRPLAFRAKPAPSRLFVEQMEGEIVEGEIWAKSRHHSPLLTITRYTHVCTVFAGNPEYKKVFVAGGTKGVGLAVVEQLSAAGTACVCVARGEPSMSRATN